MAIKHELQHSIFIGKCNKTDNATAEEDYVNAAVIILSYLQTLADILQNTMTCTSDLSYSTHIYI